MRGRAGDIWVRGEVVADLFSFNSLMFGLLLFTVSGFIPTKLSSHNPPDVLSSVNKSKPIFRGPVLLKKSEPSLRGEGRNTHTW